ncbi:MAG: hypothetical protein HC866_05780 [Leptolyngbyaceae cyanobacterium RU_5_1]|nr:hypothetical protein [Leptolyngbyaceae cyanobacterium RU_5_1]
MEDIYRCVLEGLCNANDMNSNQSALHCYLQSLKLYVIQLRQSYRKSLVEVDYTASRIQAAYLLTYYPQYAEMTLNILNTLEALPFSQQSIHACFFGSGPAPEAVAWVTYLKNKFPGVEYAEAHTYDISAEAWSFSRDITKQYVAPPCWSGQLVVNAEDVNLCLQDSIRQITSIKTLISGSKLL